jgi:hypothetical protein
VNLATELTKKGTALALTSKGRAVKPLPVDDDEPDHKANLAAAKADMKAAWDDFKGHAVSAVDAGVALGEAAELAKQSLQHGNFEEWVEKNFTFSIQWVRSCMRAAAAKSLAKGAEHKKLLKDANTVEKLAALKRTFEGKAAIEAPKRSAAKLKRDDDVVDVQVKEVSPKALKALSDREAEIAKREAELLDRAKDLKERIDAVTAREKECDRREKALALAAKPMDDGPGPLDTARETMRKADAARKAKKDAAAAKAAPVEPIKVKKGSRKASANPVGVDQGEGDTQAPETLNGVPAIDGAAEEAAM